MKPRCVITGSCYGLGLALAHTFREDYDIIEYDLELGQDLNQPQVRDQLIDTLRTCTVFFNNCRAHQLELMERAHQLQTNLAIINTSTTVGYYTRIPEDLEQNADFLAYCEEKKLLNQRCRELQDQQTLGVLPRSWLLNLRLNWLDTEQHRDRVCDKMDPGDVAGLVRNLLGMWPRIAVQEIVLVAPDSTVITDA